MTVLAETLQNLYTNFVVGWVGEQTVFLTSKSNGHFLHALDWQKSPKNTFGCFRETIVLLYLLAKLLVLTQYS
jgi:hypothetical protein